jgi:hypothetical protein
VIKTCNGRELIVDRKKHACCGVFFYTCFLQTCQCSTYFILYKPLCNPLSFSLTHTSFVILLQKKLSICAYVNLVLGYPLQRKLEGQIGFIKQFYGCFLICSSWVSNPQFQLHMNMFGDMWKSMSVCLSIYRCLWGNEISLLKSQFFLRCVFMFFCWQICIDTSNKESFQGRWAAMVSLLGLVFFHNRIWGSYCANVFLVHYLPTKTSTFFFLWSSLIRSWSWISNVDMHFKKTATKVG